MPPSPIRAGRLGDRIYTADIHTERSWCDPFPTFGVNARVVFFDQDMADEFARRMQEVLAEVSEGARADGERR